MSVALAASAGDFRLRGGKVPEWTGNPVRPAVLAGSRDAAVAAFGLEPGLPTILALGGGTGAAGLNGLVRGALPRLLAEAQVIHSAGAGKASGAHAPRYHEYELITADLPHALAAADLVVTRAGMGTLSELAVLGKPCVIVPMPDSHQEANAALYGDAGAAVVMHERDTDAEKFGADVLGILADGPLRERLGAAMRGMNRPDAAARIAAMVLALVR
jgi:UDP-N-acetylglucosamine--N-acetylmuramyl-(pentapeptide) pyrophosphoryl-undecaprenol N-acetylglucosamine transferase